MAGRLHRLPATRWHWRPDWAPAWFWRLLPFGWRHRWAVVKGGKG